MALATQNYFYSLLALANYFIYMIYFHHARLYIYSPMVIYFIYIAILNTPLFFFFLPRIFDLFDTYASVFLLLVDNHYFLIIYSQKKRRFPFSLLSLLGKNTLYDFCNRSILFMCKFFQFVAVICINLSTY